MKKKILLIVPMLHQGGFERVCVATARLLEPFCEVYTVMFDSRDIAYDIKGLNVIDLHLGVRKDLPGKCINVIKRTRAVRKLKQKLGADIAYSFGPTANMVNVFSGGSARIWVGIRSYMDMSGRRKLKLFCRKADRVLCCSRAIEEEIRSVYGCRGAVTLYNPLDLDEICKKAKAKEEVRLPWENRERIVVSMGREDDVKGFWHLLKSFSLVQKEIPDAGLIIIGDGTFEEYRELSENLGIADHVYFTGMKKNPFPYLARGQVYVLTSYNEGFPNALIEAMALGIPVIATDCMTGPGEILCRDPRSKTGTSLLEAEDTEAEDTGAGGRKADGPETGGPEAAKGDYGVLVPNMDPEKNLDPGVITAEEQSLAKEITSMLCDPEKRKRYGRAARERAGDFSNGQYLKELRRLIEG